MADSARYPGHASSESLSAGAGQMEGSGGKGQWGGVGGRGVWCHKDRGSGGWPPPGPCQGFQDWPAPGLASPAPGLDSPAPGQCRSTSMRPTVAACPSGELPF